MAISTIENYGTVDTILTSRSLQTQIQKEASHSELMILAERHKTRDVIDVVSWQCKQ